MPATAKSGFIIRITYFKPSGKWYASDEFKWFGRTCGPVGHESCYMNDVTSHIRGLRDNGGSGSLPGLIATSDGWDGYILLDCDQGYPVLLVPRPDGWDKE